MRTAVLLCAILLLASSVQPAAFAQSAGNSSSQRANQSEDAKLIEGLRLRRLFGLAEQHCQGILQTTELNPTDEAIFTIELIKTKTAQAILRGGDERASAWQATEETANQFLIDLPEHPRRLLVQVQSALSRLSHGQLLRQELAADIAPESARTTALEQLRQARSQFNETRRTIAKLIPERRARTPAEHELSSEELLTLDNNIAYQLAITNVNRAQLYAVDDRLNRSEALVSVLDDLEDVKRQTSAGQPLWWESQVLQVECFRLLGRNADAKATLDRMVDAIEPDTAEPASLLEQKIRFYSDTGNRSGLLETLQAAARRGAQANSNTPKLDLARVEAMLGLSDRATGKEQEQWLARAAQLTRIIEHQHGGYWGRRAELVLIGSAAADSNSGGGINEMTTKNNGTSDTSAKLDIRIRLAKQAMEKGRFDDAVKAYDVAAQMAKDAGNREQHFTLTVLACQALTKLNRNAAAAERLVELANSNKNYIHASAAHQLGCWNWAQLIAGDSEKQKRFIELLDQHLLNWPEATTANQAHVWLAGQRQTAKQWKPAFDSYVNVATTSPLFGDAMTRAVYCANQFLKDALNDADSNQQDTAAMAILKQFENLTNTSQPNSLAQFQALLAQAEFGLQHGVTKPTPLIAPLEQLITVSTQPAIVGKGQALLLAASAHTDSLEPGLSRELLGKISKNQAWLATAENSLAAIALHHPSMATPAAKTIRVRIIDQALTLPLEERQKTAWLYRQASALSDSGDQSKALSTLEGLAEKFPRDATVQIKIARLQSELFGESEPIRPLTKWRRLAAQLKPHTDNWYEAKLNVAQLLERSGKKEDAKKLLEYLKAIPPGWDNSRFKNDFESLLRKCKA
jgi:hypothetical protein